MADQVPAPILDTRDGAYVTAQSIGALPDELSDRSDANPAVAIIEACGNQFDKLLYQINQWPRAVIQKALSLVGVTLNDATYATVQQSFTLSQPQPLDTVISEGTQVSNAAGDVVFATTADLTISAYATQAGTVTITAGSAAVTGSGTSFSSAWAGYQIQGASGAWYTISSVTNTTNLTLTTLATSTQTSVAFQVGPVTGTVAAQCTATGTDGNVAAAALTTLQSAPSAVASTTNAAAASGGAEAEEVSAAIARAPQAFAARDLACTTTDFAYFAAQTLGAPGRAYARASTNGTTAQTGYVTVAMLSPNWTATTPASATERALAVKDLSGRLPIGVSLVDVAANITSYGSTGVVICCYRKNPYDSTTTRTAVSTAVANYLNPYNYVWGRTIYTADLIEVGESVQQVDHVEVINGVAAVGVDYAISAGNGTFTSGSTSVTSVNATDYGNAIANQTFIVDTATNAIYLITAISGGSTFTIHSAWSAATTTGTYYMFRSRNTALTNWYSLPYASGATCIIIGSV